MTDQSPSSDRDRNLFEVDITSARPARFLNYLAGGKGHFIADRDAVEYVAAALPGGIETARAHVQAMESVTVRVVDYLANEAGIRQFLNIGASIPATNDVHEVAQAAAPDSRVVYVGSDPVVLAHAHARRRSTPEGATAYVHGTLGDPYDIVRQAAITLDLARPVAVMLLSTLNFVLDESDPYGIVKQLLDGVPSGSYLVISHIANDIPGQGSAEAAKRFGETLREPFVVRGRAEVARFFEGLEAVGPGLVQVSQWQLYGGPPHLDAERSIPIYVGVGRKP